MDVAGRDRDAPAALFADDEAAFLVDGLEDAAHHLAVDAHRHFGAEPRRAAEPAFANRGKPATAGP